MASDSKDESEESSDNQGGDETMDEIGGLFGVSSDSSGDESSGGEGDAESAEEASDDGKREEDEASAEADESAEGDETSAEAEEPSTGDEAPDDGATAESDESVDQQTESSAETGDAGGDDSGDGEKVELSRDLVETLAQSSEVGEEAQEKLESVLDEPDEVEDRAELAESLYDLAEAVEKGEVTGDELKTGGADEEETSEQSSAADNQETASEEEAAWDDAADAAETGGGESLDYEPEPEEEEDPVGGVFAPDGGDDDLDLDDETYLDEDDLGDYEESSETSTTTYVLGGVVVALLAVVGYVVSQTETGTRLYHLFKGDLKQYERMQAKKKEEKLRKEMIANFPKYGRLTLSGKPQYARIKLDGHIWFGKTPESKEWRELRLTNPNTKFQNLDAEEKHTLEVMAPGHKTKEWTINKEDWQQVGDSNVERKKKIDVSLEPAGESLEEQKERQNEFMARMEKDTENDYHGEVTIETKPEGAKVIFDTEPLRNEDGEKLKTPVTFSKFYVENEKTGDLEEKKIRVDTPPDRGHKIQLRMPEDKEGDYPDYVSPIERQMWTCEWKDESERKRIPDDAPLAKHCNYKFNLSLDFENLKEYIKRRKERRKEVKKQNEKMRKKQKKLQKKTKAQ